MTSPPEPLVQIQNKFTEMFLMMPSTGFQAVPTFPYFFALLLLFHENALLSLLFHSKMSLSHTNPEIFPRSLRSLKFYK